MKALALQSHSSTRRLALVIVVLGLLALSLLVLGDAVVNWTAANAGTGAAALASAHQSAATVNDRLELASSVMGGKASGLGDLSGGSLIPPLAATPPPTITVRLDPPIPDGHLPWYKNSVSVIWEWSGNMLSSANPSGPPCGPTPVPISNTVSFSCLGIASAPVMRDGLAPNAPKVTAKNPDGSAYTSGQWVNHNVDITYEANGDNGPSGGVTCVKSGETIDKDQNADAGTNCTDAAGNIGPTGSITVRRDTTGPYTNPTLDQVPKVPGEQWYTPPLNINWNWQDAGIGVDKPRCPTLSTPVLGEGVLTLPTALMNITCYDMLGNLGKPAPFTVKVDGTRPNYSGVATAKSKNATYYQWTWTNSTVTASFRCEDKLSGPIGAVPPITRTTVTVDWNQEGADMTIPAAPALCEDKAGNIPAAAGGGSFPHVFLDSTPPVVAHTASPEPNAYLWNNTPVTVTFNCGDALSGVKDGITNPIDVKNVSKEGAGVPVPNSGTCIDKATNVAVAYTATVNIDLHPPEITPLQPVGTALIGCGTKPQFQVTDALSGLPDPSHPYTVSGPVPTLVNGTFVSRYTVTATDKADNQVTQTFDYLVYNISDPFWLSPINSNGSSVFNLGSTVPIKFTLFDCNNQPVTNADARLKVLWGGPTPPAGEVQEDTKVGNADTGNKFRRTGEYYQFNWSTKGLWVGSFEISVMIGGLPLRTTTIGLK